MHLWYTGETNGLTCIGTVQYAEWYDSDENTEMRLRIWVRSALDYSEFFTGRRGNITPHGSGDIFGHAVRSEYGAGNVKVCVAQVVTSNHNAIYTGPLCTTVP